MGIQQTARHDFSTLGRCHGRRGRPLRAECCGAIPPEGCRTRLQWHPASDPGERAWNEPQRSLSLLAWLDAEDLSQDAALSALNARLAEARQAIQPLALGQLTIPAPRSYAVGGGAAGSRLERASTTITGEVSRDDYDALIQAAGRLPGVRLQGMTSLASSDSRATLADQLLKQALETGRRRAQTTARALGLRKVELLLIDQRGSIHRPMPMVARMGEASFRPGEAPKPSQNLTLKLNYCLR